MEGENDPALAQVINAELSQLNGDELAGIWRSLCAMMLLRTANLLHIYHSDRKQKACQRQAALRWVEGGTGIITFSAACESLDMDEEWTKKGLLRHAESRPKAPINKESSGLLLGKYQRHAIPSREDFDPAPVEPDLESSDLYLVGSTGQG